MKQTRTEKYQELHADLAIDAYDMLLEHDYLKTQYKNIKNKLLQMGIKPISDGEPIDYSNIEEYYKDSFIKNLADFFTQEELYDFCLEQKYSWRVEHE